MTTKEIFILSEQLPEEFIIIEISTFSRLYLETKSEKFKQKLVVHCALLCSKIGVEARGGAEKAAKEVDEVQAIKERLNSNN